MFLKAREAQTGSNILFKINHPLYFEILDVARLQKTVKVAGILPVKRAGTSFMCMFEFLSPQDTTIARDCQGKATYRTCLFFVHQSAYRPKPGHLLTGKAGYPSVQ